jgi:hypothetical protein
VPITDLNFYASAINRRRCKNSWLDISWAKHNIDLQTWHSDADEMEVIIGGSTVRSFTKEQQLAGTDILL